MIAATLKGGLGQKHGISVPQDCHSEGVFLLKLSKITILQPYTHVQSVQHSVVPVELFYPASFTEAGTPRFVPAKEVISFHAIEYKSVVRGLQLKRGYLALQTTDSIF